MSPSFPGEFEGEALIINLFPPSLRGRDSVEDLRVLFTHLLLELPTILNVSSPAITGGQT